MSTFAGRGRDSVARAANYAAGGETCTIMRLGRKGIVKFPRPRTMLKPVARVPFPELQSRHFHSSLSINGFRIREGLLYRC